MKLAYFTSVILLPFHLAFLFYLLILFIYPSSLTCLFTVRYCLREKNLIEKTDNAYWLAKYVDIFEKKNATQRQYDGYSYVRWHFCAYIWYEKYVVLSIIQRVSE